MRAWIESGFAELGRHVYRYRWAVLVGTLAISGLLSLSLPGLRIDTSLEGYLHEDDPTRVAYDAFRDQFGRDEVVIVALRPPEVFDRDFLARLRALHEELEESVPFLDEVTSLVNARDTRGDGDRLVVEELLETPPRSDAELEALRERVLSSEAYRDLLISRDGRTTAILIRPQVYASSGDVEDALAGFDGDEAGAELHVLTGAENSEVIEAIRAVVARQVPPDEGAWVAGGPVMNHDLQGAMLRDMQLFLGLAIVTIAGFLYLIFRRLVAVVLPLATVALANTSTFGALSWLGIDLSFGLQIVPSFLMAVGVGYAVHILAIFYQRYDGDVEDAIAHALGHSGLAIAMTALTTAAGLASFLAADIQPVRAIGIAAPLGVFASFVYSVTLLPALLALAPGKPRRRPEERPGAGWIERTLQIVGGFSARRPYTALAAVGLVVVVACAGLPRLRFQHNPLVWLPDAHPLRVSMQEIDRELAGSTTGEIVVTTREPDGVQDPALLRELDALADFALGPEHGAVEITKVTSVTNVVKEIHQALHDNRPDHYVLPERRPTIAQELLLFENSGSDDLEDLVDTQFSQARITFKARWVDALHYAPFMEKLEAKADQLFGADAEVTVTGIMMIMAVTFGALIYSLATTYAIALIVITPLMMLLIGSLRGGLVSMVPNLTPILITLGGMGWLGLPLDLFTLMIGGIALGLAVDDTIHFIHNFRRYFLETGDALYAVRETLTTTGRALLITTVILAAGFGIFAFSELNNLLHFGLLTAFAIATAFIIDILVSPALLVLVSRPS